MTREGGEGGRAYKGVEVWLMNIQKSCVSSLRDAYIFARQLTRGLRPGQRKEKVVSLVKSWEARSVRGESERTDRVLMIADKVLRVLPIGPLFLGYKRGNRR